MPLWMRWRLILLRSATGASIRKLPRGRSAEKLESELPNDGIGFERLLETFRDVIVPMSRHNAHPRMFGYVQAPGTAIAAFADLLASTLNANLTAWRSAPAAVEVERLTIDWIKKILGYDRRCRPDCL